MATEIGTAYLSIAASTGGLGKDIERSLGGSGAAAGRKMGSGITNGVRGAIGPLAGMVAAVGLAKLGASAIRVGVQTAAGMEQAKISFTTMLGSATKADKFIKSMTKFAAETPFEMAGLQTSSSQLIAAGIEADKVIPIMRTLGDVTSGMGTGQEGISRATTALQQMNAAGKITGEDLNQLRDAGIPVYDLLASALGKSKSEVVALAQSGKLGKDALDKMMGALETGKGLEKFNGLMAKQSASLTGMWSNLKDTFSQGMGSVIEPLMPAMKAALGKMVPALAAGLKGLSTVVGDTVGRVAKFFEGMKSISPPSGALAAVAGLMSLFSPFGLILKSLAPLLPQIGTAFATVGTQMAATLLPVLTQLGPLFGQVLTVLTGALTSVFAALLPVLVQLATTALPVIAQVFAAIVPVVMQLVQALLPFVAIAGELIASLLPPLAAVFQALLPVIMPIVGAVMSVVQALLPLLPLVADLARFLAGKLAEGFKVAAVAIGFLAPFLGKLITWVGQALTAVVKFAVGAVQGVVKFAAGVSTKIGEVVKWFSELPGKVTGALSGMVGKLLAVGSDMMAGLARGISGAADAIMRAIAGVVNNAIDWAKRLLGIHSPSKVFRGIGDQVGNGLALGITDSASKSASAISKVMALVTSTAENAAYKGSKKSQKRQKAAAVKAAKAANKLIGAQKLTTASLWEGGADEGTDKMLKGKKGTLADYATARETMAGRIKGANDTLKGLISESAGMRDQIASSITGELDMAAAMESITTTSQIQHSDASGNLWYTQETKTTGGGFAGISAAVKSLAGKAMAFAGKLKALIQAGFPPGLVQEIAGYGTANGIGVADALLGASSAQQGELKADYASLMSWSSQAGSYVADQMYSVGIAAQQGIVNGLLANDAQLVKAAESLADKLTAAVKKKLGIKSPSRVFRDQVGLMVAKGTALGISDGAGLVQSAGRSMLDPAFGMGAATTGAPAQIQAGFSDEATALLYRLFSMGANATNNNMAGQFRYATAGV